MAPFNKFSQAFSLKVSPDFLYEEVPYYYINLVWQQILLD